MQQVADWVAGLRPPGGWLAVGLALLTLGTLAGVLLPDSPPGFFMGYWLGGSAVLIAAWCAYLTWSLVRGTHLAASRSISLAVISAGWLAVAATRGSSAAGELGATLLGVLDEAFGRTVGFALLTTVMCVATVVLLGAERVLVSLAFLGEIARRLAAGTERPGVEHTPARPTRSASAATAPPPATPPAAQPPGEMVILGPRGLPVDDQPAAAPVPASSAPAPASAATTPAATPRPAAPGVPWQRPALTMLGVATDSDAFSPADLKARAKTIEETLLSFNVQARVIEVQQGPAITQFGLDPAPGVAVNRIVSRQHDLALRLGAPSLRVLAPVPGRPLVGIEVPNTQVATVKLGDLVNAPAFGRARLPIGIGMDVSGKPVVGDLARMPHLLIAGATGSGKSVCINTLIASLLISRTPDEVQLVLIDPKQVEMSQYKALPHLRLPVVTDMDKVVATLRWTVLEMERRYTRFSEVGARNVVAFNERFPGEKLGYLVIVIDELADMMMTAAEEVERQICRLAQLGRAAGVHLVVATQRPSVDVLTGLIKANLPTRIAFAVSSQTDSRVILDHAGAERLLGRGDALYQAGDEMNPRRVQGAFVSDDEIEAMCTFWRGQGVARHTDEDEAALEKLARQDDPEEKLLNQARQILDEHDGDVTVSYLQRKLKVGNAKAARILQALKADEAAAYSGIED